MDAGVFLLQGDDTLIRMIEQPYEAESLLQFLLAAHPDLLAGDQIDPANPRRWLLVEREVGVPASLEGTDQWALDHLFLDQDATPTFVEVKRAIDTRARREVVAQMLDYAANATEYWPVDRMREQFALRCAQQGVDPAEALHEVVGLEGDEEAFWELAKSNLREGRIRLLFVADRIPASLRRIVEFLNRQMNPAEVLAVEIRQFAPGTDAPLRTLVPRVIGQTEQARGAKAQPRSRSQTYPSSRQEFLDQLPDSEREVAIAVFQAAEATGFVSTEYRNRSGEPRARMTLHDVPGTPVYLGPDYLWVSLGRHHPALREPNANREIRQAIRRVAPHFRKVEDPNKSELGIPVQAIGPEGRDHLHGLFAALKEALCES